MNDYYVPGFTDYLNSTVSPAAMTATGTPGAATPLSVSALLAPLDKLQRGRYDRPVAGQTASGLSTLDGISGLQFVTNAGRGADVKANRSGFVPYLEGAQYRLVNQRKKQAGIVTEGAGEQGLRSVYDAARNLSATQGKKAKWAVQMLDPATGQWAAVAQDRPKSKPLKVAGKIIGTALPIALQFVPGFGQLATGLQIAASAGAGGLGSALAGRDPLKGAIMGGLSGAGGALLRGAGAVGGFDPSAITNEALSNAASIAAGGVGGAAAGAGGALSGAVSGLASGLDEIVVPGIRAAGGALANVAPAIGAGAAQFGSQLIDNVASQASQTGAAQDPNEIVVTAQKTPIPSTPLDLSTLGFDVATQAAVKEYADKNLTEEQKKGLTASDWIQLAGLALSGLGAITGGGDKGTSRIPGGIGGGLSPAFKAQLPAATMPGLAPGAGGPRTPQEIAGQGLRSPQDYYRYGYGPEQSFFGGVPQGAPNTSTAFTGYESLYPARASTPPRLDEETPSRARLRMAEGGYAVGGEGDGRDDKVPALLSDGEYVMDAETVAMLGNGSSKAGAKALDDFRVNIRKHKGANLSRGKFSANAKKPEKYLKKGRA